MVPGLVVGDYGMRPVDYRKLEGDWQKGSLASAGGADLVEILIAASIVYVAAENFFVRDIRHRWWLTFLFGLIHGFGFASVLRDYGLPEDALALALASFNIGVEIGQLLIVIAAIVLWQLGFRVAAAAGLPHNEHVERRVSLAISGVVLVAGLFWLAQRLLGL